MAQHDYDIANATSASVRGDINNALDAIVSTNSGASAPSTTYANMLWVDTANDVLKIRNEANDAWIELFDLDQSSDLSSPANIASQAEAEAGVNNTKVMTALRVSQAITELTVTETTGSALATTSGTGISWTSIPSGVNKIFVNLYQVGMSGTDSVLIQMGDSGGYETTGYFSSWGHSSGVLSTTSGFIIGRTASTHQVSATYTLRRLEPSANKWIGSFSGTVQSTILALFGGGHKELSAELDRIRVVPSGSNTFNNGRVNITYE